ncbi:MAG: hypothetical protein R2712_07520 [Vicinamibacterales bacterium]
MNFTIPVNSDPPSADAVGAQLDAYDPAACTLVSIRTREDAAFDRVVDRILALYDEVVADHAAQPPDPAAEMAALAQH